MAALLFMAIVIPVAIQGLHIANLAGEVGQRKAVAARIGERVLNELKVTGRLLNTAQIGVVLEGPTEYRWSLRAAPWTEAAMQLVTVQVNFPVEDRDYDVRLSTLVSNTTP